MPAGYGLARKIRRAFGFARGAPLLALFRWTPAAAIVRADLQRYVELCATPDIRAAPEWQRFMWVCWRYWEFRSILYYRVLMAKHWPTRLLLPLYERLYPGRECLYIKADNIGPGLFIQHGFCTALGAKRMGANCWVNQEVTIGYIKGDDDAPVIGDNVRIAPGAKVLGDLTVGDNVTIGPNTFVHKSIPPNCTVVGVPGVIVQRDGKMVRPRRGLRR